MLALVSATVQIVLVALLLLYLVRRDSRSWLCWTAAGIGAAVFAAEVWVAPPRFGDYEIFLESGREVLAGRDPYAHGLALNTPQAMAVFAAAAWLPPWLAHAGMLGVFLLAPAALTWLGVAAVRPAESRLPVPPHILALLSAILALSFSYRYGMDLGQLGVITALGLLAAVAFRRVPWLAGTGLFVGSLKIATMLPFMFLFLRRADRWIWAVLIVLGLAATLAANPPGTLIERCRSCLALIDRQSHPGGHNDVSAANSSALWKLSPSSVLSIAWDFGVRWRPPSALSVYYCSAEGSCMP